MEMKGQLHAPIALERVLNTHWIRSWIGLRAYLDLVEYRRIFCPVIFCELYNYNFSIEDD
jgi:hypothetical protein